MTISKQLISVPLFLFALAACSGTDEVDDGATSTGGNAQTGTGGSGGSTGTGGASTGGSVTGGGGGSGGAVPSTGGAGGAGTGGTQTGGTTGSGGANNGSGGADTGAGGDGSGGSMTSSGGTSSVDGDPNPSGYPEPGDGGIAAPSGTAGNLQVIPWAGFLGALTYTFDDAKRTQQDHKDDILGLGVPFTWYLTTGAGGDALAPIYQEALDMGHELGNHTLSHPMVAQGSDAEAMQTWLMDPTNYGVVAYTLAAPNGRTENLVDITNQKFLLDRGVTGGTVGAEGNANWTDLPTAIPAEGAGENTFKGYADTAASGKWQTVCIHGFQSGGMNVDQSYQPVDFNGWKAGVEYAQTKNIWISSMVNVASYIQGAKAVSSATPTSEGGGQKWTWTLKDTFPPGRYIRVTVDGGTLSQDGTALPWNDHGFYEVSLDAGELTLMP